MLKKENITQLAQIYNTLSLVNTNGDSTLKMADCLKALRNLYDIFEEEYNKRQEAIDKEVMENIEEQGE